MEAMPDLLQSRASAVVALLSAGILQALPSLAQTPGAVERLYQDQQQRDQIENLRRQQAKPSKPLIQNAPKPTNGKPSGGDANEQGPPIKGVKLEGSSLFPASELLALQQKFVGQPATAASLRDLQSAVAHWYDHAKILSNAGIPRYGLDGIVTVPVVEAHLGAVRIERNTSPISSDWAIKTVLTSIGLNREFRLDKLESALLKLNDLGGVVAHSSLEPGQSPGTTDVLLSLKTGDQVQGQVGVNNYVVQYTGPYQAQGTVSFGGLMGLGETFVADGAYSGNIDWYGSRRLSGNGTVPVTPGGLNWIGSYSFSDYRLLKFYAPDNWVGSGSIGSIGLNQVLWRRPKANLALSWTGEVDHFVDSVLSTQYSNRTNWVTRVTLQGDKQDSHFGGIGLNSGLVSLSLGNLSKDADGENLLDQLTMGSAGGWGKLNLLYDRYQSFKKSRWTLELLTQGQLAFKNLDSVEKMSLGWPNGVRAYPPGEAVGDSGLSAQLTARYQVAKNVVLKGFVDGGYIWKWTNWFDLAQQPGSLGLWGPGVGVDWGTRGDLLLSVDLAFPLGANPGSINGLDSDGTNPDARLWVSLRKWL